MTRYSLILRGASVLAAASVILATAHGQTYSSPVRVTNTPLPVSGQVAVSGNVAVTNTVPVTAPAGYSMPVKIGEQVLVSPAAGTMPVAQQGTVTVTPSGGTLPVAQQGTVTVTPASGTLPVAQQGTVTVTPAGGTMPVSGAVLLSGSASVTLSGNDNQVRLAGTPFWRDGVTCQIPDGEYIADCAFTVTLPEGAYVEIELLTGECYFNNTDTQGKFGKLFLNFEAYGALGYGNQFIPIPATSRMESAGQLYIPIALPVKIYAVGGSTPSLRVSRWGASTGLAQCRVNLSGRSY